MDEREINYLSQRLYQLAVRFRTLKVKRPTSEADRDLSDNQFRILFLLSMRGKQPLSMKELAQEAGLSLSHLSKTIKELEDNRGLVQRFYQKRDRRRTYLRLLPRGKGALSRFEKARIYRLASLLKGLDKEELERVEATVEVFDQALTRLGQGGRG